jgi:phospholipase D1/2
LARSRHRGAFAFEPGRNCWRVETAARLIPLVDGAEYFHAFRETAKRADRSLLIVGWDIDSRFALVRNGIDDGLPRVLGEFLVALLERNERLRVHLLDWNFPALYGVDREWLPTYTPAWTAHPRLSLRLDDCHPVGACHHQKIVVVDDRVAFVAGLDFALGRWDTPEHAPGDERRREPTNGVRQPYHDLGVMVEGDVAAALGELGRLRWLRATGETLEAPGAGTTRGRGPWPPTIEPVLTGVPVAIARTRPTFDGEEGVREIEHLLVDAIRAARHAIYIEAQYLTADRIGRALEARLAEREGPEVVVVMPRHTVGWLSRNTMDVLRVRLIRKLIEKDAAGRLRVCFPRAEGLGEDCVNVHAKLLIVDDRFVRVGSSNLNNRSMGVDTECDLALAADGDERIERAIGALRTRLLAEHLGAPEAQIRAELEARGSLIEIIDARQDGPRTLAPLDLDLDPELEASVPDAAVVDPAEPFDSDRVAEELLGSEERDAAKGSLLLLGTILLIVVALALLWRLTPLGERVDVQALLERIDAERGAWLTPFIVSALYVAASLVAVPVTLLIVATGLVFGAWWGFGYAVLGAEVSALVAYAIGRWAGHRAVERISDRWIGRVSRRLARQGLLAVVTLRFVPIAPFTVINLVAGASHIRFRDFALGTLLGIAPGALLLTAFAGQLALTLGNPETVRVVVLVGLGLLAALGTWVLGRWLLKRRGRERRSS